MRASLKSVEQMLEGDDPPEWVILLERTGIWCYSRLRVVIHDYATIDSETSDGPVTWILREADYRHITAILKGATPETIRSVREEVIDGDPCELTIIHGRPKWLAYAAVNLCSVTPEDEATVVARLAKHLTKIVDETANKE